MTRKDYVMIAEAIRDAASPASGADGPRAQTALRIADYIADGLYNDNPRFDRKRFMAACGFDALD